MSRPSIQIQLSEVTAAIREYPEYKNSLELHRRILEIREPIEALPTRGTSIRWDRKLPEDLWKHLYSDRRTAREFLTASIFDKKLATDICQKVIGVISHHSVNGKNLIKVSDALAEGKIDVRKALEAIINQVEGWFDNEGKKYEIVPELLFFIFSVPLQPCFEEISRKLESSLLDSWWQSPCPVCGGTPKIAWLKNKKRYLTCAFCGTQYLMDMFLCAKCGSTDPHTLGYLKPKDQSGLRVDFCENCRHYIKVIDRDKLKGEIPLGLEDILTQSLDKMIQNTFREMKEQRKI